MPVRISSTPLKRSVKSARTKAKRAIDQGKAAIVKAKQEARRNPTEANRRRVARFERTLDKAKDLDARLKESESLANAMCPMQIMFIEFVYV